jgi:hypothetical protein
MSCSPCASSSRNKFEDRSWNACGRATPYYALALNYVHADAMKRLPKTNVDVYFHARLLKMKRMGQLDLDRFRANGLRWTALPREKKGESRV